MTTTQDATRLQHQVLLDLWYQRRRTSPEAPTSVPPSTGASSRVHTFRSHAVIHCIPCSSCFLYAGLDQPCVHYSLIVLAIPCQSMSHYSLMNSLLASKRCHSNSLIRNIRRRSSSNNNITHLQITLRSYWNQLPILFGTTESYSSIVCMCICAIIYMIHSLHIIVCFFHFGPILG